MVAPEVLNINITATLEITDDYELTDLQSDIEESIENYIHEVQQDWSENDTLVIYVSRLIAAILEVDYVINVADLKINNSATDLVIELSGTNVKFPELNEVTLSENQ